MRTQYDILLDRDSFRKGIFYRDNYKCVICGEKAVDAHHIIERRLFKDGGYYLNNGASLCAKHHLEAEMTILDCETIRNGCNITQIILPEHFYSEVEYDKWGNQILKNGQRLQGELFWDSSVQKILKQGNILGSFTNKVKYPRTYHLPWSPGMNRDDRQMTDVSIFEGERVMICEKLDGENTSMGQDYIHARSINTDPHPSRNWVKNLWAQKGYNIPPNWRVCGENMFAKHAIHYSKKNNNELNTYFYMFSIWDDRNVCLSWEETKEWAELLDFSLIPVIYEGIFDLEIIHDLNNKMDVNIGTIEGYVIRLSREYHYSEFKNVCGKYVRKDHVQNNHGHWASQKIIKNELKS